MPLLSLLQDVYETSKHQARKDNELNVFTDCLLNLIPLDIIAKVLKGTLENHPLKCSVVWCSVIF
jgi:hypothetical protein